jgi:hypothetical protein
MDTLNQVCLTDEQIINHVKNNTSNEDYNFNTYRGLLDFDYKIGVSVDLEKLKQNSFLMEKIERNFVLAVERINKKLDFDSPSVGDFIKVKDRYLRIALVFYDDNNNIESFQYTEDGSFYMSENGNCSYSGGFCFDFGGRIETKFLRLTEETKQGGFWFFSQDRAGAHKGVYFKGDFKVWKVSKKAFKNE